MPDVCVRHHQNTKFFFFIGFKHELKNYNLKKNSFKRPYNGIESKIKPKPPFPQPACLHSDSKSLNHIFFVLRYQVIERENESESAVDWVTDPGAGKRVRVTDAEIRETR